MKKCIVFMGMLLFVGFCLEQPAHPQGALRKLKQKVQTDVINKAIGDENKTENAPPAQNPPSNSPVTNTKGKGLANSTPDVKGNISDALTAYEAKNYSNARFAARQALLGIEIEIGKKVLENLPKSVSGMDYVEDEDNVSSMSIGFVGFTISRVYRSNDKELRVTIGNDATLLAATNMYLAGGGYATTSDPNHKMITYKGYRSVIQFDEGSGYTLSVPFGQSSIFVLNGINFENEQEIMNAADKFDIDKIKNELGEK